MNFVAFLYDCGMRLNLIHILIAFLIAAFSLGAEPSLAQSMPEMQGCAGQAQKMPTQGMGLPAQNIRVLAFAMPAGDRNNSIYIEPETAPPRG